MINPRIFVFCINIFWDHIFWDHREYAAQGSCLCPLCLKQVLHRKFAFSLVCLLLIKAGVVC